ncbi:MAG: Holliday junction resolvase RuvX [Propionibacteriales bacterium]|nr:Holliday junction resolvase RuvX [Propionibacteriales bacterium]
MRTGVRVAVDLGDVRIGIAVCDSSGLLAVPLETIRRGPGDFDRLAEIVRSYAPLEVVIGLPRSLSGREGPAATKVREIAHEIGERLTPVPVRLVDERLTTVTAERVLSSRGRKGARRRAVVDQAAAVVLLQHVLDSERGTGSAPGEILDLGGR